MYLRLCCCQNLTAKLEECQKYEGQLLQKQKELNRCVSHLRQLLNEKTGAEQALMEQNQSLQHDCRLAYQDNRNLEQKVATMERQWQQNVADQKKAGDSLQKVLEQQEQTQRYNRYLREELANCQEKVVKEQEANGEIREEKENLQRLLNEEQREKANIVDLLSDADAAIEQYKQGQENEVLNISSHDIQLTHTELGRGAYGSKMHAFHYKVAS